MLTGPFSSGSDGNCRCPISTTKIGVAKRFGQIRQGFSPLQNRLMPRMAGLGPGLGAAMIGGLVQQQQAAAAIAREEARQRAEAKQQEAARQEAARLDGIRQGCGRAL